MKPLELSVIGPHIYNQAISDAQAYMRDKALDPENTCYAPESNYWDRHDKRVARPRSGRAR